MDSETAQKIADKLNASCGMGGRLLFGADGSGGAWYDDKAMPRVAAGDLALRVPNAAHLWTAETVFKAWRRQAVSSAPASADEAPAFTGVTFADLFERHRRWSSEDAGKPQLLLANVAPGTAEHRRALRVGARISRMLTIRFEGHDRPGEVTGWLVAPTPQVVSWLRGNLHPMEGDCIRFEALCGSDGTVTITAQHTTISTSYVLAQLAGLPKVEAT